MVKHNVSKSKTLVFMRRRDYVSRKVRTHKRALLHAIRIHATADHRTPVLFVYGIKHKYM